MARTFVTGGSIFVAKVIYVFCGQMCFCLCGIINLTIVKKYQIVVRFFHQIIEEVLGITLAFVVYIGDSYNDHSRKTKFLTWKNLHKKYDSNTVEN